MNRNAQEQVFSEMMSGYRLLQALKLMVDPPPDGDDEEIKRWRKAAHDGLMKHLTHRSGGKVPCENDLQDFISANKEWIRYAFSDMLRFPDLVCPPPICNCECNRMIEPDKYYMNRMRAQAMFIAWELRAFELKSACHFTLLDIGCGPFSYAHVFHQANISKLKNYIGIDKRDQFDLAKELDAAYMCEEAHTHDQDMVIQFIEADVEKDLHKTIETRLTAECIFFGEVLHCVKDPLQFVKNVLGVVTHCKVIKILEVDEKSVGLGTCFDLHMQTHSPGKEFTSDDAFYLANQLGWHISLTVASSQHMMYTLTRRH